MSTVFDHPLKYEALARSYTPGPILTAVLLPVILNLVPDALVHWFPGAVHPSFAPHLMSSSGPASTTVWILTALQVPAMLLTGHYLTHRRVRPFQAAYFVQGVLQFVWLQLLAWQAIPYFPLVGVAVLFGGMLAWAFNESFFHYDGLQPRIEFLVAFVAFDALLLGFDLAGREGLLWAWERESSFVVNMLGVQGVLILVTQIMLRFVGEAQRIHDARVAEIAALEREVALATKERHLVQRLCDILDHGVSAARFSQDIASPVVTMDEASSALRELVDEVPPADPLGWRRQVDARLGELRSASHRVLDMTRLVARSVRGTEPLAEKPVDALVRASVDATRNSASGLPPLPVPRIECQASSVWVTPGHTSDLASLLVGQASHGSGVPLVVQGAPLDDHYYHLQIRDQTLGPAERDALLARMRPVLALEEAGTGAATDGLGFGLELSKISLVRHHGWLDVTAATAGAGLVVHVVLPRRPPAEIPGWAQNPAEILRAKLLGARA